MALRVRVEDVLQSLVIFFSFDMVGDLYKTSILFSFASLAFNLLEARAGCQVKDFRGLVASLVN